MADGHDAEHDRHEAHTHEVRAYEVQRSDCSEIVQELYVFLDGELTDAKRTVIQHHLDDCSPCLEAFDFHAELRMIVAHRCRDEVPAALRQRVLMALEMEGGTDGRGGPPPPGMRLL